MSELLHEQTSAFEGNYPEITHRSDFAIDDDDDDPIFMTLPIGEVNSKSRNGRFYDRAFYTELVRQVNGGEDPVTGIVGHRNLKAQSYEVKLPSLEWVGATLEDDTGLVLGKAYVLPEDQQLRRNVRRAKKRKKKVATSIWGTTLMRGDRATKPELKSIDYVDPARAGVEAAIATPIITQEMIESEEKKMPENTQDILSELRTDRNLALEERVKAEHERDLLQEQVQVVSELETLLETKDVLKHVTEMKEQISEMKEALTLVQELRETLGTEDVRKHISELVTERDGLQKKTIAYAARDVITEQVEFEDARPLIANMIGMDWEKPEEKALPFTTREEVEAAVKAVTEQETVQEMLKALVLKKTGGRAYVGDGLPKEFVDTPEAREKAVNEWGLAVANG